MIVKTSEGKGITYAIVRKIQANREYLSEIDGLSGDGDHGINMSKGFTLYWEKAKDADLDFASAFRLLGRLYMLRLNTRKPL
jgi:dihydroxyacetone kinase-like protein